MAALLPVHPPCNFCNTPGAAIAMDCLHCKANCCMDCFAKRGCNPFQCIDALVHRDGCQKKGPCKA